MSWEVFTLLLIHFKFLPSQALDFLVEDLSLSLSSFFLSILHSPSSLSFLLSLSPLSNLLLPLNNSVTFY